jgi:magnesium chelatase subunit D
MRGRPIGVKPGDPRRGARLSVIETLRAAAPWQRLRRRQAAIARATTRVVVRAEDFRVVRHRERSETATIFVVDASGSAAIHRLAEAKGAVELLLADCYVRRDQVALIAFRGGTAETLLPPTRSLVRAKRSLGGLPGGGATPLATGIDAAGALALTVRRHGATPTIVFLTDGRANIARDGSPGRARAEADAGAAARTFSCSGFATLLLDISPRAQPQAQALAKSLGAAYVALPYADARGMSSAVRAFLPAPTA